MRYRLVGQNMRPGRSRKKRLSRLGRTPGWTEHPAHGKPAFAATIRMAHCQREMTKANPMLTGSVGMEPQQPVANVSEGDVDSGAISIGSPSYSIAMRILHNRIRPE